VIQNSSIAEFETDGASAAQASGSTSVIPPALEALLHLSEQGPYKSRSEVLFAFLCEAIRRGLDSDAMLSACLDSSHAGHVVYEDCIENGGESMCYVC
jgi:hypothetical protein